MNAIPTIEELNGQPIGERIKSLDNLLLANKIARTDQEFAKSLVAQANKRGLSPKQVEWVNRLIIRGHSAGIQVQATTQIDLSRIVEMFNKAREKLRYPKIWLKTENGADVRISQARDGGLHMSQAGYGTPYYGKIEDDGSVMIRAAGEDIKKDLIELLTAFATNPEQVAADFGKVTGHCCFCSKHLTDDRSLEQGYGPVCAKNYGLVWG